MPVKTVRDSAGLSSFLDGGIQAGCRANYEYSLGRLGRFDAASGVAAEKHLLIDGANFLQGIPAWQTKFRRNRTQARSELVTAARRLHDFEGSRVTVVFDGRGAQLRIERDNAEVSFSVIHTPDAMTADDVIERLVAISADPARCTVVTADRAMADTVIALGAATISLEDFSSWLERAGQRQSQQIQGLKQRNDRLWNQSRS